MHIYICFTSFYKSHLSRYKYLQIIKAAKKCLIKNYLHKMISYISRLQDKSSGFVESNIQCNSRCMSSSNITAASDTSSFSTSCNTSLDSNQIYPQKVQFLIGDHNTQKKILPQYTPYRNNF